MYQLTIKQCQSNTAEIITDYLEAMDALSVTLTDNEDSPILEPEIGSTPLWNKVIIQALFEDLEVPQYIIADLAINNPSLETCIEEVESKDWERVSLDLFKPKKFGKNLWVVPSWHTPPDLTAINLTLDPGLAFGTGMHPTTSLCLTWLDNADLKNKNVIDYGCGSGILAIAALKLGAKHVFAVDLDEQALIATKSNAILNSCSDDSLTISLPEEIKKPVDLIIANILLQPLMQLKTKFKQLLNLNGLLVVSGILKEQEAELIAAYKDLFSYKKSYYENEWCLITFQNRDLQSRDRQEAG